jgi:hypothetical protein
VVGHGDDYNPPRGKRFLHEKDPLLSPQKQKGPGLPQFPKNDNWGSRNEPFTRQVLSIKLSDFCRKVLFLEKQYHSIMVTQGE